MGGGMNHAIPAAATLSFTGSRLPPGPGGLLGVRAFPLFRRDYLTLFTNWARRYGDVCCYRTLRGPVCLLSAPEHVEEVLVTQTRSFVKGRGSQLNRRLLGNGLLTSQGTAGYGRDG